jgi:hypothetical protein
MRVLVKLKPALRQPRSDRSPQLPGMLLASGVDNHVIAIALEQDEPVLPDHPRVERVVQEHVRQQGRDRRPLRSSAIPRDHAAILALQRRFEPPLHVQQDPAQVGVTSYRLENEVMRNVVEKRLQVQV